MKEISGVSRSAAQRAVREVFRAKDAHFRPDLQLFAGDGKGFYWEWAMAVWPLLTPAQRNKITLYAGTFFLSRVRSQEARRGMYRQLA
jgi:hypothetical protein